MTLPHSHSRHRDYWISTTVRLATPVLEHGAAGTLKQAMPIESSGTEREKVTHLEAIGRLLCGIAPWLELEASHPECGSPEEREPRQRLSALARETIAQATDPDSPAFLNFEHGGQPLVDAAFLAQALLRAPKVLWEPLDERAKANVVAALRLTSSIRPGWSNWLLFASEIETFFASIGEQWDSMRVDYALRQHEQWYLGGGIYGDGPHYRADYYNSFVIQPMLLDLVDTVGDHHGDWAPIKERVIARAQAAAALQEQIIAPDGSFPATGRSIAYRFGAFQLLSQVALQNRLPEGLPPARVRCALTSVLHRVMDAAGTFDENGWLRIGLAGHQPGLGEGYISTGSLYLTAAGLLALGLPPEDPFWSAPDEPWTSQHLWSGEDIKRPALYPSPDGRALPAR